jgi:hypothetical protein
MHKNDVNSLLDRLLQEMQQCDPGKQLGWLFVNIRPDLSHKKAEAFINSVLKAAI